MNIPQDMLNSMRKKLENYVIPKCFKNPTGIFVGKFSIEDGLSHLSELNGVFDSLKVKQINVNDYLRKLENINTFRLGDNAKMRKMCIRLAHEVEKSRNKALHKIKDEQLKFERVF